MAQWVTIWRAAQLVGVPRGQLQQQVQAGELELNDGLVSTDRLLSLYPDARLEESGMLERVARIRDESFGRRLRERVLPSQEVLSQRLFRQTQELADVQRTLQQYHRLVLALRDRLRLLDDQARGRHGSEAPLFAELLQLLNDGLARALATEPVNLLDVMDDMLKMVSAQVTVRPSGHQFTVEGHESLLQAGMRAGLKLNYGCGNGTCGMCKVRVTSGQVVKTMPTDYALSDIERAQGYVLSCAHSSASSELTLETLEAAGPDDIPPQELTTTVRALKSLAHDTLLLHLQTPRSQRLRFLAGQHVTLGVALGDGVRADFPIASCPCDDRNLQFYVARNDGDAFASRLFAGDVKVGDSVSLWGPRGRFVLGDEVHPLVFAACDTGFAPVKSLIEHALSLDASPGLSLFWLSTRADGHFMSNLCRSWSEALDTFEFTLLSDVDATAGAQRMAEAMRADLFDIDCSFYIAGPAAFVDTLRDELSAAGVPASQIHGDVQP